MGGSLINLSEVPYIVRIARNVGYLLCVGYKYIRLAFYFILSGCLEPRIRALTKRGLL